MFSDHNPQTLGLTLPQAISKHRELEEAVVNIELGARNDYTEIFPRGHGRLRRGRSSLDAPPVVPGGVARTHSDQLDVPPGRSKHGIPAVAETGGSIRRETPALGACRAGAPPGAKGFGEDSPERESRQSQHR
ncbi:hypothetical protein NDU88_008174 [Pleurodeles waltl]|uniref:Uncharacterized protein n=1 Tax=Pleurodeles waltl TaxID=8319 RepID=A0AAV7VUD8_PLEWA|nr:hypothetical protein NDU88_008174 [Pleurodeles waltl]